MEEGEQSSFYKRVYKMIENFNKIKEYVLTLGGFEVSIKLDLQIEMIINEALAYCYRDDVLPMMESPLADVIVRRLKSADLTGIEGNVASYSEGDMSISINTSPSAASQTYYGGKLEPFKQIPGVVKNV